MKRLMKMAVVLLAVVLAAGVTMISAGAVSYSYQAGVLNSFGLLNGTGNGYELDRASTRVEAATMLVRLLGKEAEAQAGTYQYPFKDVPAWADKYVGYLYANGLTKGTSDTTFSPDVQCDANMYTVLVLRALGYTESSSDFTYAGALNYAVHMGLIDAEMAEKSTFLRDDMVAISYAALYENPKNDKDATLLDELVSSQAVTAESADGWVNMYKTYHKLVADGSASALSLPAQLRQNVTIHVDDMGESDNDTMDTLYTVVNSGGTIIMKADSQTNDGGVTSTSTSYFVNGWAYTASDQGKYKYHSAPVTPDDLLIGIDQKPIYQIQNISRRPTEPGNVYTINFNKDTYKSLADSVAANISTDGSNIAISDSSSFLDIVFDAGGKLQSEHFHLSIEGNTKDSGATVPVTIAMDEDTTFTVTGGDAAITLPTDLGSYVEKQN